MILSEKVNIWLCFLGILSICLSGAVPGQAQADLYVNEVMADNDTTLADPQGQFDDWIEIYNAGTQAVDLGGMHLTDNPGNPDKWEIPDTDPGATTVAPGGFLLFWADKDPDDGVMHVDFNLDASGEEVLLVEDDGSTVIDRLDYPAISSDLSFGRYVDGASNAFIMVTPTPGAANALPPTDAIQFSIPGGPYVESQITLTLASAAPAAAIYYTTDGSIPTDSSTLYTGPIVMANTTWIRARGYEAGKSPSLVDTHVYMFIDSSLAGFSSDLPVILMDSQGFDHEATRTRTFQPAYFTVLEPGADGRTTMTNTPHLTSYGGAHARGASSFGRPKVNLAIEFWTQDNEDLDAPLLGMPADSDWVLYGPFAAFFDNKQMGDNVFAFEMFRQMGHYGPRTRYVELFINADSDKFELENGFTGKDYHGVYVLMEKVKRGDKRVDIKEVNASDVTEPAISGGFIFKREQTSLEFRGGGENLLFVEPIKEDMNGPMTAQRDWLIDYLDDFVAAQAASSKGYVDYVDMHSWVDTHLFMSLTRARDTMTKSRYTYKDRSGKLVMGPPWDYDGALDGTTVGWTGAGSGGSGSGIWTSSWWHKDTGLFKDYDFWQAWVDRYFELRCDVFSETNLVALVDSMSNAVYEAHFRNAERWAGSTYPQYQDWLTDRVAWMDAQFPSLPMLSQTGGVVASGYTLTMSASDTLYYTTDGTDPRDTDGAVGASAAIYAAPLTITSNTIVRARTWDGTAWTEPPEAPWSAPQNAIFAVAPHTVAVTELMVEPREPGSASAETNFVASDFEFVEIVNTANAQVDLAGLRFSDGISFDWSYGSVRSLAVGESAIIVRNLEAFKVRYPSWASLKIAGEYEGSLNDGGERIRLSSVTGQIYSEFTYNNGRGWPVSAGGAGHSLVPRVLSGQETGLLDYAGNWRASGLVDGSPGLADPEPGLNVVLNEVVAHTDTGFAPPVDSDDWVELYNPLGSPVDVSGWMLSDDADRLAHYTFPTGSVIAAGGFMTVTEILDFHTNRIDGSGFGLDKAGEQVFLSRNTGSGPQVVDAVRFKGQANGVGLGRSPDGGAYWYELALTTNAPNALPPSRVVISELMVHPLADSNDTAAAATHEYVEIFNPLGVAVDLWTESGPWRIDGGVDYVFPTNISIQPSEYCVVVGFDPTNSVTLTDFLDTYGLTPGQVRVFGPFEGRLDNRTERVALERPQAADAPGENVSWIIVDETIYFVDSPWPLGVSGTGGSLQRSVSPDSGRDPANWLGAIDATPGVPGSLIAIASPRSGTRYFVPDTVEINVAIEALQVSNAVSEVGIYDGTNVLCVLTQAPYRCVFDVTETRSYFLSATVTDAAGVHTSRQSIVDGLRIDTLAATHVTDISATCVGAVLGSGDVNVTMYWGDEDGQQDAFAWDSIALQPASGGVPIGIGLQELTAGRTYYYRFRAEVEGRSSWSSNSVSFLATPLDLWGYTLPVSFTGAGETPLTDFPVLVRLHEGISGFAYSQFASTNGYDLRVGHGVTDEALLYEIDTWDTNGTSDVWVQIPQLTSNSAIKVHWGYTPVAATPAPYAVDGRLWRKGYAAVWHLDAPMRDSAGVYPDASVGAVPSVPGIVGSSLQFDGIERRIRHDPPPNWYNKHLDGLTVSMWVKPSSSAATGATVWGAGSNAAGRLYIDMNRSPFVRKWRLGVDDSEFALERYVDNAWQYLAVVFSNNQVRTVFNDNSPTLVTTVADFTPSALLALGSRDSQGVPFYGEIDELRMAPVDFSAAWLRAEYDTVAEHGSFTTYGVVETSSPDPDGDGDGIPDAWENRFPTGTAIEPGENADADALSNYEEFIAGTDPTNAMSTFSIDLVSTSAYPVLRFYAIEASGAGYEGLERRYSLEFLGDLSSTQQWAGLPGFTNLMGLDQWMIHTNLLIDTRRNYRARAWLMPVP